MTEAHKYDETSISAWAHRIGILDMGPGLPVTESRDPGDRAAICECIARYCWAYDERRSEHLSDCFTCDAIWEGSVLGQVPIGPLEGREAIVDWLSKFWPHQKDQRRHMLLNTIVEAQSAEAATTLSYLLLMASTGDAVSTESMGFYKVNYRLDGLVWRIERLTAGFDKPFWPGKLEALSAKSRARHGLFGRV